MCAKKGSELDSEKLQLLLSSYLDNEMRWMQLCLSLLFIVGFVVA